MVVRPRKLGIGSAHKLGWLHARRMGYARIATLDADLSHDPADVQRLLDALDAGADVAIGSRFLPGRAARLQRASPLAVSRTANVLAASLLRLPIAEHTTSLRAAKLARVPDGLGRNDRERRLRLLQVTCMIRLARAGLKIAELPIHFRDRHHGVSKISKRQIVLRRRSICLRLRDRPPAYTFRASRNRSCPIARSAAGPIGCASPQANCGAWRASASLSDRARRLFGVGRVGPRQRLGRQAGWARPKSGAGESWPISTMPRRIARVRVK